MIKRPRTACWLAFQMPPAGMMALAHEPLVTDDMAILFNSSTHCLPTKLVYNIALLARMWHPDTIHQGISRSLIEACHRIALRMDFRFSLFGCLVVDLSLSVCSSNCSER